MQKEFLQNVLGVLGTEALSKAAQLSNVSDDLVFARSLLSWIELRSRYGYNSIVPGTEHHLRLKKNAEGYTGVLTLENETIPFANDPLEKVAAYLAISLGTVAPFGRMNFNTLPRLGKSIDILVKTQYLSVNLKKAQNKAPSQGKMAKPIDPVPPVAPELVQPKEVKPELGKKELAAQSQKTFKLKTLDFKAKCKDCGEPLFKNMQWTGCMCLGSDAKVAARGKDLILEGKGSSDEWLAILTSLHC